MVMSTYQGDLYRLVNPGPHLPRRILEADELLRVVDAGVIVLDAAHGVKVLHRYAAELDIHGYTQVQSGCYEDYMCHVALVRPRHADAARGSLLRPLGRLAWRWPELVDRNRTKCL